MTDKDGAKVNGDAHEVSVNIQEGNDKFITFALEEDRDLSAQYWGPTKDIAEEALVSLVERYVDTEGELPQNRASCLLSRQHGVYNSVYTLQFPSGEKVCVRVPACGWSERWNESDATLLRQTALAMKMLQERTDVPLPGVIAYDCSLENDIGAPFILLKFIDGTGAREVWNAEEGVISKEMRRQNILRSIARAMAGLRHLKYSSSGSLWFGDDPQDGPVIGESWNLRIEGYIINRRFETAESYSSTRAKVMKDVQVLRGDNDLPDDAKKGALELYQLIAEAFLLATEVAEANTEEVFALMHADFDIQNIMVDDKGNLTGILDWDGLSSQPRQVGWSMVPFWLQSDWSPSYQWPPAIGANYAMIRPDEFEGYRQDYARYLWEICDGVGDCRFTANSHRYRAFLNSTTDCFGAMRFVENVLADILPRSPSMAYCARIGERLGKQQEDGQTDGFQSGEKEWLEARLRQFFRPEPPLAVPDKKLNATALAGTGWTDRGLAYMRNKLEKGFALVTS